MALLNTLLSTETVHIRHAWSAHPLAASDLPAGTPNNVEQHVGASFTIQSESDTSIPVRYERAECTHGKERAIFEIEGTEGALRWNWEPYAGDPAIVYSRDNDGELQTQIEPIDVKEDIGIHDKPLVYFTQRLSGESAPIRTNENALFDFRCLRAIYETAETNIPAVTHRDD